MQRSQNLLVEHIMEGIEWPIATLSEVDQKTLGTKTPLILLSKETLTNHLQKHPEIGESVYQNLQQIIEKAELWRVPERPERLIYMTCEEPKYLIAIKRNQDGTKNYVLTIFRNSAHKTPKGAIRIR